MINRRTTEKYKKIIEIFNNKHTLSIAQVADFFPNIDFSTIYRNILKGVDEGVLQEVPAGNIMFYEKVCKPHDHFICESCEDIYSIHIDEISIGKSLPKGFAFNSGSVIIRGLCSNCN